MTGSPPSTAASRTTFTAALETLATRRLILFGGKGGVGKTTISVAAALHFAHARRVTLFSTDPASNLHDLLGESLSANLTVESLDASAMYSRFLEQNMASFLEIGDRGTYLDREELQRLLELSMPGADELMGWMHIGELVESDPDALVIVDTAPTGHTLRMLSSGRHFRQLAAALDAMQEKHRALVRQFTRRDVEDAADLFIDDFAARAARRSEMLSDAARTAFVPVTLSEPLVVEQTIRLCDELGGIDIPFVVLNRAHQHCRAERDRQARAQLAPRVVADAEQACVPLDSADRIRAWMTTREAPLPAASPSRGGVMEMAEPPPLLRLARMTFVAGKGGVGKTSCCASIALQLAQANPGRTYVVISVDPAHSLRDLFAGVEVPPNLRVETIDTRAKWDRFRETLGDEIESAVDALTPGRMSLSYDAEAMRSLIEIAPPGADELFAITRLASLASDASVATIIVDTAPTGHFLRLLELPQTAGEWVREFMRILLRYREVMPAGSLGEELVRASKSLKQLDQTLRSDQSTVVVVTRPERLVIGETRRLLDSLRRSGIAPGGVIANYVTPASDCPCDQSLREHERALLSELRPAATIARRETPPASVSDLRTLVPLSPAAIAL